MIMKRFIFILLTLLLAIAPANAISVEKSELKAIKKVLKAQIEAANKYDYSSFIQHFDPQYINSDGFSLDVYSKLVEDTWGAYTNIQYGQDVKNLTITGNEAIAEVVETANAQVESQYNLKGNLKSVANNIYFLKKTNDGWKIVSDVILTEDTQLAFGELSHDVPTLRVPYQMLANRNYTATLEYKTPKDAIAIASINQERVTYPQETAKENYRKLPEDGILERFFTANSDNTNEYIVAAVGLTRPQIENKDLQITITGVAYIIKRVNIIPENKFVNVSDIKPVSERLLELKEQANSEKTVEEKSAEPKIIKESSEKPLNDAVNEGINEKVKEEKTKIEETSVQVESVSEETAEEKQSIQVAPSQESVNKESINPEKNNKLKPVKKQKEIKQKKEKAEKPTKIKKDKPLKPQKEKELKPKKDKLLKGSFSPTPVDIPTTVIQKEVE